MYFNFFQHPAYNEKIFLNDIALIKLETPVAYSDNIKPICLPDSKIFEIGDSLTVTGWVII